MKGDNHNKCKENKNEYMKDRINKQNRTKIRESCIKACMNVQRLPS